MQREDGQTMNQIAADLQPYIPVLDGMVQTFTPFCEIALHDLRMPETSLVYLAGNLTGRKPGGPITDLVLKHVKKYGDTARDIIGYKVTTKEGKELKATTVFIRDAAGKIIGCFCINFDITHFVLAKGMLEKLCKVEDENINEHFALDVTETIERIISDTMADMGIPAGLMTKEEKIKVISELDDKGVFLVKGAVDHVARYMNVSRYTIYNYLDEARANQNNSKMV